jgi:para-nitrobenzyl esterase
MKGPKRNIISANSTKIDRRTLLQGLALAAGSAMVSGILPRIALVADSIADEAIATTTSGKVRGFIDNGVLVFKGIPYGDDTSKRRFRPPAPPVPWDGVRDALAFGSAAPMVPAVRRRSALGTTEPTTESVLHMGEDCLVLNVWTPGLGDGVKRPVMVYIHGGAYNTGTSNSNLYDGVNLCRQGDVVVVTMNHRLNIFGYLYLAEIGGPQYADSGNVGMLDLILMLQWVRDNISEFGGDPENILIFGQSGGGAKCATLMSMPEAKGLFHRVISMSGQQVTARQPQSATQTAKDVLKALGFGLDQVDQLQTVPVEKLLGAMKGHYFGPVKDGRSVPRDPFDPDAPPLSANIPMMLGNCHDETTTFFGAADDPSLWALTWDDLPDAIGTRIKNFLGNLKVEDLIADYRRIYPEYSPSQVFFASTTAFRSWRSQLIEAERRGEQNSPGGTWVYQLNWGARRNGIRWAGHASDIPLAFNNFGKGNDFGADLAANDPDAPKMARIVSDIFIAFARRGVPQTEGIPRWPIFDLKDRATMIFDLPCRIENDPRGGERRLIEAVAYVQPGTRD